jgi:murein DD-endopeptidase MepM/ murein hydrolase activator NlpD
MSTVRRRGLLAAALVMGVLLSRSAPQTQAAGPDVNGAMEQQRQMQAELQRQRAQLASLVADQSRLGASLQQLSGDLAAVGVAIADAEEQLKFLEAQLQQARTELASYREQLVNLRANLEVVAGQIVDNEAELAAREGLLQDHLRHAYAQSQISMIEVILSSRSFTDVASELGDILALSDADLVLANQIHAARQQLDLRQATLRDGRATYTALAKEADARAAALADQQRQLDAARAALAAKQAQLVELQREQAAQLAAAMSEEEAYRQKIAQQEAALAGQAELVRRLQAEADKLDTAYHGRFAWPLRGNFVVTQEFGHTAYEYFHSGIDLAYFRPMCGGPIYAAADGVVLADGRPNVAYGDTAIGVILGHSQRLQTWYWHLSREIVSVGQEVHTGDLIGYEGATGWATGCHLHFQVMFDGSPVNPRNYLP